MNSTSREWREKNIWTLECDDFFKENSSTIDSLYQFTKTSQNTNKHKELEMKDASELLKLGEYADYERIAAIAYSLSKMTIINEMDDFAAYNNMLPVEFKEFLARAADLLYPGNVHILPKLEKLLVNLFQIALKEKVT